MSCYRCDPVFGFCGGLVEDLDAPAPEIDDDNEVFYLADAEDDGLGQLRAEAW